MTGKNFSQPVDQIATDNLHVIEIELHPDIGFAEFCDHVGSVLDVIEKIIRPVTPLIGSINNVMFFAAGKISGLCQIGSEYLVGGRTLLGRNLACKTMDRAGADGTRVLQGAREQCLPILFASRNGGKAKFALALAWRRVQPEDRELVLFDCGLHRRGRDVVRKLQLDRLEACSGRRVDPFEQRALSEEIAEIGGKTRHSFNLLAPILAGMR